MDKNIFIRKPKKVVKDLSDIRKIGDTSTYFMDIKAAKKFGRIKKEECI